MTLGSELAWTVVMPYIFSYCVEFCSIGRETILKPRSDIGQLVGMFLSTECSGENRAGGHCLSSGCTSFAFLKQHYCS